MSIEAVVFDFGKVIAHFDHQLGIDKLRRHVDVDADHLRRVFLAEELEDPYESGRMTTADFFRALRDGCRFECSDEIMRECLSDIFWPNEEIRATVRRLAAIRPLFLLSNTCEMHADRFRVEYAETFAFFQRLFLSHEVGLRKPKREVYEHVQREIGCSPESIVFIDDREENVDGARACGWKGIVYRNVPALVDDLRRHGFDIDD